MRDYKIDEDFFQKTLFIRRQKIYCRTRADFHRYRHRDSSSESKFVDTETIVYIVSETRRKSSTLLGPQLNAGSWEGCFRESGETGIK